MVGNCEKTTTSIEWTPHPQNHILLDDQKSFMASSDKSIVEKTKQDQVQPPPLKCPRCDSSNTKFCYYNNYSLSQPRHFCKACKRYWTRGGTLRNVPVGGGCRKNKRVKRQPSNAGEGITSSSAATHVQQPPPQIDLSPAASDHPLFYGMPTNPLDHNFPFSRFSSSRVSSGLDLLPQMNGGGLGIGFLSSSEVREDAAHFKQIQDHVTSSSSQLPPSTAGNDTNDVNLNPMFFGSSSFGSSSTMASLLASSLQHQKFMSSGSSHNFSTSMLNYNEEMQMPGGNGAMIKEVVKTDGDNRSDNYWNGHNQFHEQINTNSDSSSIYWNTTNIGAWIDPSNMGSSVSSLI